MAIITEHFLFLREGEGRALSMSRELFYVTVADVSARPCECVERKMINYLNQSTLNDFAAFYGMPQLLFDSALIAIYKLTLWHCTLWDLRA